jgi:site-specific DNA-methyltransferase (adenine-specific)
MAMCEYAWTSFNSNAKVFEHVSQDKNRIHPTQKPVALYEWILNKYAKEGDTILDTHVGSASSLIACHRTRHKFVGFEIDKDYYEKAAQRLKEEQAQLSVFDYMEEP